MSAIRKNTWYESPRSKRFFVVVSIWWRKPGEIDTIELLEKGCNDPVILGEPEMLMLINNKELVEVISQQ